MSSNYIRLINGKKWDFIELSLNRDVPLDHLLWGIANITRFTGQAGKDYDVLRHSWVCREVAVNQYGPLSELVVSMGFHDVAEAVMGDVSSPLKSLLKDYRDLYHIHENFIIDQYGLPDWRNDARVKTIDSFVGDVEGEYYLEGWEAAPATTPAVLNYRKWIRGKIADSITMDTEIIIDTLLDDLGMYLKKGK